MNKIVFGIVVIFIIASIYLTVMVISAIATVIGSVVGMVVVFGAVVAWFYLCWKGYCHDRQTKKTGVGK